MGTFLITVFLLFMLVCVLAVGFAAWWVLWDIWDAIVLLFTRSDKKESNR